MDKLPSLSTQTFKLSCNLDDRIKSKLILADGTMFNGYSFGYNDSKSTCGELVFNTNMVSIVF